MIIETRNFGKKTVDDDAIYTFPQGIYGFEDCKEFAVFQHDIDEELSLLYLQNTKDSFPCFLVFEPWDMYENYNPILTAEDLSSCQAESADDLIFLCISKLPSSLNDLSINLKSPIVLNPKTMQAKQVILQNPEYEVRYFPFTSGRKDEE